MTSADPLERFRRLLAVAGEGARRLPQDGCLADEVVAALVDGSLEPHRRTAALTHLAGCVRCRGAVASVARALADVDVTREVAAVERHGGMRWRRAAAIAVPLAAASIVVLLAWPTAPGPSASRHPASTLTAAPAPTPIAPLGIVAGTRAFVWTTTLGTDRYRLTVFDSTGVALFETESVDTAVLLPDSVRLQAGGRYFWKVEARTDIGRWANSELVEFSLVEDRS